MFLFEWFLAFQLNNSHNFPFEDHFNQNYNNIVSSYQQRNIVISPPPSSSFNFQKSFSILVWNIFKGKLKHQWQKDFELLNQMAQLTLIQEAMIDGFVDQTLKRQNHQGWNFSLSFSMNGAATGVATGCHCSGHSFLTQVSPDREPILKTPKVSQLTYIPLFNQKSLLIINIHAINFVKTSKFKRQIESIIPYVQAHNGPIIWAGDFNTWNQKRMNYLIRRLSDLGFTQVTFPHDNRLLQLDHIFVKNCLIHKSNIFHEINSSDHKPLFAELSCYDP